jgi:sporulation protein YlmC with PRC-barrel domain
MENLGRDNMTGKNTSGHQANVPLKHLTASSIIGDKVFTPEGESLGEIKDIMIDITEYKVAYVVIEFGGFLGMNQKYFAIPLQALSVDPTQKTFVMQESRESLKKYPGFDKDHWPVTNSHAERTNFSDYGGFMGSNTGSEY